VGDEHDGEGSLLVVNRRQRQGRPVNCNVALGDDKGQEVLALWRIWLRQSEGKTQGIAVRVLLGDESGPVDMALYEMATKAGVCSHGAFQVYAIARMDVSQGAAMQSFGTETDFEGVLVKLCDGQADAVDGYRVADVAVAENVGCVDCQAESVTARFGVVMGDDGFDDADGFDLGVKGGQYEGAL